MPDEVPVALKLPRDLHQRIKELAPSRGASAWMIRALELVAAHPEVLDPPEGILDDVRRGKGSRGTLPHDLHPYRVPPVPLKSQVRRAGGNFSREVNPVWKKGK